MKKETLKILIPVMLSILVLFFLFKNETISESEREPVFKIGRNDSEINEDVEIDIPENSEFQMLSDKIKNEQGIYGLYIKNMLTDEEYELNPDEQFYPLSLFKLPLAYIVARDVEKEDLSWDDMVEYKKEDYHDGLGTIGTTDVGSEFTLIRIVELMLRESDNTAPKMLKRELGEEYLNDEFKKITGNKNANLFDEELLTTPKKCSQTIEGILYINWINEESVNILLNFLYPTSYDNKINPYLEESLTFYHKVGIMEGMYHDCGIIKGEDKDLILCLMSKDITEESFNNVVNYIAEFVNEL